LVLASVAILLVIAVTYRINSIIQLYRCIDIPIGFSFQIFLTVSSENFLPCPHAHEVSGYRAVAGKKKKSFYGVVAQQTISPNLLLLEFI